MGFQILSSWCHGTKNVKLYGKKNNMKEEEYERVMIQQEKRITTKMWRERFSLQAICTMDTKLFLFKSETETLIIHWEINKFWHKGYERINRVNIMAFFTTGGNRLTLSVVRNSKQPPIFYVSIKPYIFYGCESIVVFYLW